VICGVRLLVIGVWRRIDPAISWIWALPRAVPVFILPVHLLAIFFVWCIKVKECCTRFPGKARKHEQSWKRIGMKDRIEGVQFFTAIIRILLGFESLVWHAL
jgi:hypothetical protein